MTRFSLMPFQIVNGLQPQTGSLGIVGVVSKWEVIGPVALSLRFAIGPSDLMLEVYFTTYSWLLC